MAIADGAHLASFQISHNACLLNLFIIFYLKNDSGKPANREISALA